MPFISGFDRRLGPPGTLYDSFIRIQESVHVVRHILHQLDHFALCLGDGAGQAGRFDANEKEYGVVGAAVMGVGDAVAEGASATVSLSEKALNSVEDAGSYIGQAVETGFTDVGSAAMAAYAAVRNGLDDTMQGVENAGEAGWDTIKAGAEDVAGMAGDVVHAAEAGAAAVADVAVDAWHGVEHLASEALHGIEKGTGELEHLGSEAWTAVENGAHRARDYAGRRRGHRDRRRLRRRRHQRRGRRRGQRRRPRGQLRDAGRRRLERAFSAVA